MNHAQKQYDDAAEAAAIYNTHGEVYHRTRREAGGRLTNEYIDMPTTWSLLPKELHGLRILDAGCGSGMYARLLAEQGAHVVGVDVSEKMIAIAKAETLKQATLELMVGNIYELPFADALFDIILCTYVLENVQDIQTVLKEFFRVLKTGGCCVISISHPIRAHSSKQVENGKAVWVLSDYYDSSVRLSDFGNNMKVKKWKRTIEDYCEAITEVGFVITAIREPRPLPDAEQVDPSGYEMAMRLPQLFTIRLRK